MKRTRISPMSTDVPASLRPLLDGSEVYDSSCSRVARVWFIDRTACVRERGEFYLKSAPTGMLEREAVMTRYFYSAGLAPEVTAYITERGRDYLLTRRVAGEDATHATYLADPRRLSRLLGETLRELHDRPTEGCPGAGYLDEYIARAEANYRLDNYDRSHFPDSFGYRTAADAMEALQKGKHLLQADTLIHGDFCLPNILLDDWHLSAYIDLGNSGVGDRHIDLFWGAWSLGFNLGTDAYREDFFRAYGMERVDPEVLRVVAAAEVFG